MSAGALGTNATGGILVRHNRKSAPQVRETPEGLPHPPLSGTGRSVMDDTTAHPAATPSNPPIHKRPYCPRCGVRWRQIGNRTGHCSGCHRTFSGLSTFDAHQRTTDEGTVCSDPSALSTKDGAPRFRNYVDPEGAIVWRSAAELPEGAFDKPAGAA